MMIELEGTGGVLSDGEASEEEAKTTAWVSHSPSPRLAPFPSVPHPRTRRSFTSVLGPPSSLTLRLSRR